MDMTQQEFNYQRIARAIDYIRRNYQNRPGLTEVAEHVNMSPFHFQRMFSEWAGTSPKKFLSFTQLTVAKKLLKEQQLSVYRTQLEMGLASSSRLHELFTQIEGMSPAQFKKAGKGMAIDYSFHPTPFGSCVIASTPIGICYMAFCGRPKQGLADLNRQFPNADIQLKPTKLHQQALSVFTCDPENIPAIKLHLKGSPFQLKVWEALLKIPAGQICSYGQIAEAIGQPGASRAVGTAIGQNLIGFLIPCHRVIQSGGAVGGYRWDVNRKIAMLGWEQAITQRNPNNHE